MKQKNTNNLDLIYQLLGWIVFILCALCFIISSYLDGDTIVFIGSILFFVGCILFLIPLIKEMRKK